jgi:two-component system, NtrC family, sensor kinase
MSLMSLKKLVFRKELAVVKEMVDAIDPSISIQSDEGHLLLGERVQRSDFRYPIQLDDQIIGWVTGTDDRAKTVATLLTHFSYREMEKRTLAQELLSKYKEVTLLFNLSEKLIDSLDIQEVASLVLEEAKNLLKSTSGSLMLLREGSSQLETIAQFGEDQSPRVFLNLGDGILGNIIQTGRGEIINDIFSDPRHMIAKGRMQSMVCVPLKNKEKVIGAITLHRSQLQPYAAEDLKLLMTLACQTASVINGLLHERKLKESKQNELVFRLSGQIRDSLELSVILETAVAEIYRVLQLDRCCFLWYQTEGRIAKRSSPYQELNLANLVGGLEVVNENYHPSLKALKGYYPPEQVGSLGRLFLRRDVIQMDDISALSDTTTRHFLTTCQFASLLAIPVHTMSGHVGVLCCGMSRKSVAWTTDEVRLLQAVTNQLAIAIDQAELFSQSQMAFAQATTQAVMLEKTVQELRTAQAQLVQNEKMSSLGQLVAGIAHEINNPVNFIHGNVTYANEYMRDLLDVLNLYQKEYPNPTPNLQQKLDEVDIEFLTDDFTKLLSSMQVGTDRICEIVRSLRIFSRLDESEVKAVNLHEGLDSTLMILQNRLKAKQDIHEIVINKQYAQIPLIECHAGQLNQVFMNVLVNAIDAIEEAGMRNKNQPQPTIAIQTEVQTDWLVLTIRDSGPGMPEHVKQRIFDPFFTTKPVGKGTGMGMSISYQIITEKHGGKLDCITTLGQGTAFIIHIPLRTSTPSVMQKQNAIATAKAS